MIARGVHCYVVGTDVSLLIALFRLVLVALLMYAVLFVSLNGAVRAAIPLQLQCSSEAAVQPQSLQKSTRSRHSVGIGLAPAVVEVRVRVVDVVAALRTCAHA